MTTPLFQLSSQLQGSPFDVLPLSGAHAGHDIIANDIGVDITRFRDWLDTSYRVGEAQGIEIYDQQRVVGLVAYSPHKTQQEGMTAGLLDYLWTAYDVRRNGLGRLLLGAAEEALRVAGDRWAKLYVDYGQDPAKRLYEKCGWVKTAELPPHYRTYVRELSHAIL